MGKPHRNIAVITQEFLYQAYCVEKRGIISIAREVGCRNGTIIQLLKDYGLHFTVTKEWMEEHYVHLQESVDDIAAHLECDESTVRYYLRQYAIPIRYKSRGAPRNDLLNNPEWLHDCYVTQRWSLHTIAHFATCNVTSVVHALTRFNISRLEHIQGINGHTRNRSFVNGKRTTILERDRHQCRFPECTNKEHLELHHIIPIAQGGPDAVENGITLCRHHHRSIASKELEYIQLFQTIINQEPLT